ncbi:hypothetical protein MCOR25_005126 [Pyricularia grisea]|uniref:AAA+ ATPase domain-containing protein n=1 Tax=Pyricularia grisea TaxID=148305 RepID=A0A6P8BB90_PYRGI|nr:uncharacterized protein PgNI_05108 [Pyricularia grisea]KAI6366479.1 hypothetical protein MCOR25_005126 [Pyricularia grisea]TLD13095.1 hypothetical protein PgNI_05108 [Pyricularia grisea]
MSDAIATLIGLQAATGGTTIQDILNRTAPGLSFIPSFLRKWLQIDISAIIGLLSLIGAMSSGFHFLNHISLKLYWTLTRFCTASVAVAASDRLNREVLNWLSSTVLMRQGTRVLAARSEMVDDERYYYQRPKTVRDDCANETRRPVEYMPTFGTTWFWHRKRLFIVRCVRTHNHRGGAFGRDSPEELFDAPSGDEPLVVMCFGRSVAPIKQFLDDCRDWGEAQRARYVTVRTCKKTYNGAHWDSTILRPTRPIQTVHFDEQIKKELVADIINYLDPQTRDFYHQRGIPYRRGYLLHGPPGTGKTSLSLALASMFKLELYLLHVPSLANDGELESMFDELPPRCIILLEDIDAVGIQRRTELATRMNGLADDDDEDDDEEDENGSGRSRSTLSGLLNVLDGVASQEGRIVFMTSNLADKLDPALVRPGRIDRKIYLGNINQESARLMFLRMYAESEESHFTDFGPAAETHMSETNAQVSGQTTPPVIAPAPSTTTLAEKLGTVELDEVAAEFASQIPDDAVTPALIQGFLLSHRSDPLAARDGIQEFIKDELSKLEQAREKAQRAREAKARKRKSKALAQLSALATLTAKTRANRTIDDTELAEIATDEEPVKSAAGGAAGAFGGPSDSDAAPGATEGAEATKNGGGHRNNADGTGEDITSSGSESKVGEGGSTEEGATEVEAGLPSNS